MRIQVRLFAVSLCACLASLLVLTPQSSAAPYSMLDLYHFTPPNNQWSQGSPQTVAGGVMVGGYGAGSGCARDSTTQDRRR